MRTIDLLFGWREISAEGETAKQLTDFLLQEGVPAELVAEGEKTVIRVSRSAAKKIRVFLSRNGLSAQVGRLRGAPAGVWSFLRRPGIVAGVLAALFMFVFARGRIWNVSITGDGSVDEDTIREIIWEAGLRPGMKIRDVSPNAVATKCLLRDDLFSGMNVSLSGVVAKVTWLGRKEGEPIFSETAGEGVNLVASCDGVIVSVQPTAGTAVVAPGQTVHKGDLLVSGVNKGGGVRAAGVVTARIAGEFSTTVPVIETKRTVTKRRPISFSVRLFGEELISIGQGGDSAVERELTLPGGIVLPFSFRIGYAHTVEEETVDLTEAEAALTAHRRLHWIVSEALSEGELLKTEIAGGFGDGGYTATAKIEYLINIAKPLAFTMRNEYNK